jgi:hypothetical protein
MSTLNEVLVSLSVIIEPGPGNLADNARVEKASLSKVVVSLGCLQDVATTLRYLISENTNKGIRKNLKDNNMDDQSKLEETLEMFERSGSESMAEKAMAVKISLTKTIKDLDTLWEQANRLYWLAVCTNQGIWKDRAEALYKLTEEIQSFMKKYSVREEDFVDGYDACY